MGVFLWLGKERDKYGKTVRRILYTALLLAVVLGAMGYLILTLKEPYRDGGGAG